MENMSFEEQKSEKNVNTTPGTNPTFLIKVVYAKNFSLQGYIRWLEKGKSVPFRSYMEMLHLIEEGLYNSKKETSRLRAWDLNEKDWTKGYDSSGIL